MVQSDGEGGRRRCDAWLTLGHDGVFVLSLERTIRPNAALARMHWQMVAELFGWSVLRMQAGDSIRVAMAGIRKWE